MLSQTLFCWRELKSKIKTLNTHNFSVGNLQLFVWKLTFYLSACSVNLCRRCYCSVGLWFAFVVPHQPHFACGVVSRIFFLVLSFIKIGWKIWELWGGRNFGLSIDLAHRLYNSLLLPHKPWSKKCLTINRPIYLIFVSKMHQNSSASFGTFNIFSQDWKGQESYGSGSYRKEKRQGGRNGGTQSWPEGKIGLSEDRRPRYYYRLTCISYYLSNAM